MPTLQAGAAQTNITPFLGTSLCGYFQDRKAADVHDELHAKSLVLDDGTTKLAFVICDVICVPKEVCDEAKALITQRVGLPPSHVLIAATHTHTAPTTTPIFQSKPDPDYLRFLTRRIADAVQLAAGRLQPARWACGVGSEPRCVFNRRFRMRDGTVRMNPGYHNPDIVECVGPTDPDVAALVVETVEGAPIAALTNYALHYVGAPGHLVSADYFGMFAVELQRMAGASFVAMMSNGCSGDINNIDVHNPPADRRPFAQTRKVARMVAAEVWRTWQSASFQTDVELAAAQTEVTCDVRKPMPEELAAYKATLSAAAGPDLNADEMYARERILVGEMPDTRSTYVQAFRIGHVGVVALSGEIFCQFGLDLKAAAPLKPTFIIELANDYTGYVPTRIGHEQGGYETWLARSSYLAPDAGEKMVDAALNLLGGLR
jgi:hypothetical protein